MQGAVAMRRPACWKCRGTGNVRKTRKRPAGPCTVCDGSGHQPAKKVRVKKQRVADDGTQRGAPPGWTPRGPAPLGAPTLAAQPGEALSYLCGKWKIFQGGGLRYSTDDVVTAAVAASAVGLDSAGGDVPGAPPPTEASKFCHLDLGCGQGSVLLMMLWRLRQAWSERRLISVGLEAQSARAERARRSAAFNIGHGCVVSEEVHPGPKSAPPSVSVLEGDLRDLASGTEPRVFFESIFGMHGQPAGKRFDLVTGTPPYFSRKAGAVPDANDGGERAGCLFELRGGFEAYCAAAGACLESAARNPRARFAVCMGAAPGDGGPKRAEAAMRAAGLQIVKRVDVFAKEGKPHPLFAVYVAARREAVAAQAAAGAGAGAAAGAAAAAAGGGDGGDGGGDGAGAGGGGAAAYEVEVLTVRDAAGKRTAAYKAVLEAMGKPPGVDG